ncbi:MAG: PLP-dependent transferase [Succinivibrio sp.]|nr:PLP-dependent transferase [Succinivibrio sp.]
MKNYSHIETSFIHGGISTDEYTGAVNVPIYQTSTYAQKNIGGDVKWEYSRTGNPTRAALESLIAELEGGNAGFAFGSGMAALTAVISLFKTGDKILISSNVYGGTYRVLDKVFSNFGITDEITDTTKEGVFEQAITPDVKAVIIETPANPLLTVTDLEAIAKIAHKHNLVAIADNTFMTPYLQRPLEHGFDIVVHSATKYLGGHSDVVAGLVVTRKPEHSERIAFIQNATGGVAGPFDSFLMIRGIKTLAVRMDRHAQNAHDIAEYLQINSDVKTVYYPGLTSFKGHEIHKKQAKNGGAMISFELTEDHDIRKFFGSLRLISLAESLGGVESLVCHPASMTHASIPRDLRIKLGITDNLIRLSVGIENASDLISDIKQAIEKSRI